MLDKAFPKRVSGFNPVGGMMWIDGHQFLFSVCLFTIFFAKIQTIPEFRKMMISLFTTNTGIKPIP